MEAFQDYAYYYNAFYQDKDYVVESRQVDTLLKRYGRNIRKVINYGCGIARPVMHDTMNVVDVCYEVLVIEKETGCTKTINETHHMRYFFRPELEFYLKESGFELIDNLDCTTLGETGYGSWTSYFMAKAV